MTTLIKVSLFVVAALALAACAPPANTNTNTNANSNIATKPAAPTSDALMALEKKAWEAYKNKDATFFEGFISDNFVDPQGKKKSEVIKAITEHKDEVKSYTLSDPHVTSVGADAAVLTYKGTVDGTMDGKPAPSPLVVATVFVRSGSEWKAVYHNEVPIAEAPKTANADKKEEGGAAEKKDAASSAKASDDVKKPMTDEKKEMAAPASNSNSNSSAVSNSASSNANGSAASGDAALTEALMAIEKKGWDAWKAKDAKSFDDILASDFAFVDTMGKLTSSKADAVKGWTTDNPCNVSNVSLSDGKGYSISKDVAMLVVKGTATGTCGDAKIEPLWNTSVFVKDGDTWKVAYIFETPDKKMM